MISRKGIGLTLISIMCFTIVSCSDPFWFFGKEDSQTVEPSLLFSVVRGAQGDIVGFRISPGTVGSLGLQIGDYTKNNYELKATVDSGVASEVVLRFDTTAAGDSYDTLWADGEPVVSLDEETSLSSMLATGDYEDLLRVPDHQGRVVDRGVLQIESGTVEDPELLLYSHVAIVDQVSSVDIPISTGDVDSIWIKFGSEDIGYQIEASIRPRLDDDVDLNFDTGASGSQSTTLTTSQDAEITELFETDLSGSQLAANAYPILIKVPDEDGRDVAVGTMSVRSTE